MKPRKSILIEISPGELIDRLTILQIRAGRVTDPRKAARVRRELEAVSRVREESLPHSGELDELAGELRAVNAALWEVEDDIRAADAAGEFGAGFVEFARSVCRTNDRRAELKQRINALLEYAACEEKLYRAYSTEPNCIGHECRSPGAPGEIPICRGRMSERSEDPDLSGTNDK